MYRDYSKQSQNKQNNNDVLKSDLSNTFTQDDSNMDSLRNMDNKVNGNEQLEELDLLTDIHSNNVNISRDKEKRRKLVIHFDIRNTVLVADSITNVSVEQALNSFLTGVTWGREDANGDWQWHSDKLTLTPPAPDTITYYKYLEKKYVNVKNTTERTMMRLATGDFTSSEIGKIFYPQFKNHLEQLKWKYDFTKTTHDCLTMSGLDGQQYNYIVPAVYKCINHLVKTGREFAIVFRTYGLDGPNVIKSLEHGLKGNHPGFPSTVHLPVNENVGTVKRSDTELTVFKVISDTNPNEVVETCAGDREIYNMLTDKTGISGFRDDIQYWLDNLYNHDTSKTHIIDPFDESVHHIFFDDNIRTFEDDSIVDIRLFETNGAEVARSLQKAEAAKFDNMCMVQADLMQCIENENYYLERVEECETNYSKFLRRWNKMSRACSLNDML